MLLWCASPPQRGAVNSWQSQVAAGRQTASRVSGVAAVKLPMLRLARCRFGSVTLCLTRRARSGHREI